MATYAELLQASENEELRNKVRVAIILAAEAIRVEAPATPNNANRLLWARDVFRNGGNVESMMRAVLAANAAATYAAIVGASDAAVQGAVDAAVNVFAQG